MDLFGKQHAENLRQRTWKLEEFQEYFREEGMKEGNSEKFQNVVQAFSEFSSLQNQIITEESAVRMIGVSERLRKACNEYSNSRRNAKTPEGRERLAVVDCLDMYREDLNLDQARDMKIVRDKAGTTWGQAGRFEIPQIDLELGGAQILGSAVSQRIKTEFNGKKGFFTEEYHLRSNAGFVKALSEEAAKDMGPEVKSVLDRQQERLAKRMDRIKDVQYSNIPLLCNMGEYWNQMDEKDPRRKKAAKELLADQDVAWNTGILLSTYKKALKDRAQDMGREEKIRLFRESIQKALPGEGEEKSRNMAERNMDFLLDVPLDVPDLSPSAEEERYFKAALIQAKAERVSEAGIFHSGKKDAEVLDRLIDNGNLIHRFTTMANRKSGIGAASAAGELSLDSGNELTSRNIATTRMAELLGVGHIAARSEKMMVRAGGKVMTGCFMEFAKGYDLGSKNERVKRMFEQTEVTHNPSFLKDLTTLEAFDYLCAQNDRHNYNMFYQLSEPDKDGKRTITGLQGIDNDLAFGESEAYKLKNQSTLNGMEVMTFIDRQMAEKISGLNREKLEYALGDVLSEKQMDLMVKRVEKFQKHMADNMVKVEADGWELNKYTKDTPVANDREKKEKENYLKGVEGLNKSLTLMKDDTVIFFKRDHKDAHIGGALDQFKEERKKEPKVAISFAEIQKQERHAPRAEPKVVIGRKSESALERVEQIKAEKKRRLEEMKAKETKEDVSEKKANASEKRISISEKRASVSEKKSQGAAMRR